jgi:dihydroxyacetone kinase
MSSKARKATNRTPIHGSVVTLKMAKAHANATAPGMSIDQPIDRRSARTAATRTIAAALESSLMPAASV